MSVVNEHSLPCGQAVVASFEKAERDRENKQQEQDRRVITQVVNARGNAGVFWA